MDNNKDFTIRDLSAQLKSKTELYNVLTSEAIFICPKQDSTQKFMWSILLEAKVYVKWDDVTVIKVPQFKGLFVRDLLKFA